MKLGAVACRSSPRLPGAEREAELERGEPGARRSATPASSTQTEADLPLLGEHDLDDVHCRILTSGTLRRRRSRSG